MQGYVYDIEADNLYIYSSKFGFACNLLTVLIEFTLFPYEMEKQDAKRNFEWHNSFGPDELFF